MLNWVKTWYQESLANRKHRLAATKAETNLLEQFANLDNIYVDTDKLLDAQASAFVPLLTKDPRQIDFKGKRDISFRLCEENAHIFNILNLIINYSVGPGFEIKLLDEQDDKRWQELALKINFRKRIREIVRRIFRDGECFIRKFGEEIRFVEPDDIKTPVSVSTDKSIIHGIKFSDDDIETVVGYFVKEEFVDAEEIFHITDPYSDLNSVRGTPPAYRSKLDVERYQEWLRYRLLMNKIRASIAFVRQYKNSTGNQLRNIADSIADGTVTRNGKDIRYAFSTPGVGMEVPAGQEIIFPPGNIDAGGAEADGRAARLIVSTWVSLSEAMVSTDTSNANYGSTLIGEAPAVKTLLSWQNYIGDMLEKMIDWLMGSDVNPDFTWPTVVVRDVLKEAQARQIEFANKIISRETWMEIAGQDAEIEMSRIDSQADSTPTLDTTTVDNPKPENTGVAITNVNSGSQDQAAASGQVQQTALNGSQVDSLLKIASLAATGGLPTSSATALILAAFPLIDPSVVNNIISPLNNFKPTIQEIPVKTENNNVNGNN